MQAQHPGLTVRLVEGAIFRGAVAEPCLLGNRRVI
jgi:hypothetical protein